MVSARPRYTASHIQRRRLSNNDGKAFMQKTIRQFFVSVIVFAIVFAISKIDLPIRSTVIGSVNKTLSYTIDYKKVTRNIADGLKKLPGLLNKAEDFENEIKDIKANGETANESDDKAESESNLEGENIDAGID